MTNPLKKARVTQKEKKTSFFHFCAIRATQKWYIF